jgi:predicted PurR-regulated permease PerM
MTPDAIKTPGEAAEETDPAAPADPAPTSEAAPEPRAGRQPVVVARWVQLVLLPVGLLALWAMARAAGTVLLIFLVGAVIALVLNPLVELLRRTRLPRGLCVLVVYLGFFAGFAGLVALLVDPVSNQVANFQRDVPHLVNDANSSLANFQSYLDRHHIGIHLQKPGQTALQTLQRNFLRGSGSLVSFTRDLLQRLAEGAFAVVLVLVISVYMLLYGPAIGRLVRSVVPRGDGSPDDDYPLQVQKAVFSYVRGQFLFSLIMGTTAGVALWIFGAVGIFPEGRTYALAFGAFFGLMELVPYVGPVLGALPPVLVALFGDPLTAVWVALLFVGLQQIEGHIVAPQVFGHSLRINPLLIIFALLFGTQTYGIIGALISLPIAAVARETAVYLRRHLVLEPWNTPAAGALATATAPPPPVVVGSARACPECGRPAGDDDAYCRTCGAGLALGVSTPG